MSKLEYYAGEFCDSDLDALAEAGDDYLDKSGFFLAPTQDEMQVLTKVGDTVPREGLVVLVPTSALRPV